MFGTRLWTLPATTLTAILVLTSAALVALVVVRPGIVKTPAGKVLAFIVLFLLPVLCGAMGVSTDMERSTTTAFCLSCHTMEWWGQSLHIDDPNHIPAAHFQNHRVPPETACYTCHTDYAMFGTLKVKIGGLRHVYVYYLGTPPAPENIKLYQPFNNANCLHCHLGARSFEEGATHTADPATMKAIKSNSLSCISSGCHDVVHDIGHLKEVKFWKESN
jgi:cytochrome c-type protein NapC